MLAVCTTGPPSPSGHGYLRISNRSSFPRKRESRYLASILDSRWSLPSTRSGAGMAVRCCAAIGRLVQYLSGGLRPPYAASVTVQWWAQPTLRALLVHGLNSRPSLGRGVSPSPGPSGHPLPVGEGKSVRPPAAGSWKGAGEREVVAV